MNLIADNFFDRLDQVQDAIAARLTKAEAILEGSGHFHFIGGVNYGTTVSAHAPLINLKGRVTKKYAHAVVTRMESGRYELIFYVF